MPLKSSLRSACEAFADNTSASNPPPNTPLQSVIPSGADGLTRNYSLGKDGRNQNVVQLVDFKVEHGRKITTVMHANRLSTILEGYEDYPVIVVSITGVYRSGKSFLLNLLVTYLQYLSEHDNSSHGWTVSEMPIQGISWARQSETVTFGVGMWKKPHIITNKNGTKIVVLLVDCQGTGDVKESNTALDNLIFYISLQLSNVQMINLRGIMETKDLTTLDMCKDYANALADDPEIFNHLIYIERDWQHDDKTGKCPQSEFDKLAKASDEIATAVRGIKNTFKVVDRYRFPHPGAKVLKGKEEQFKEESLCVTEKDIDPDFLTKVKELFDNIICDTADNTELKTCGQIVVDFEHLEARVSATDLEPSNTKHMFDETLAYRAYNASMQRLEEGFEVLRKFCCNPKCTVDKMNKKIAVLAQEAIENYDGCYQTDRRGRKSAAYKKYEKMIQECHSKNRAFLIERIDIEKERRDLAKDVDELAARERETERLEREAKKEQADARKAMIDAQKATEEVKQRMLMVNEKQAQVQQDGKEAQRRLNQATMAEEENKRDAAKNENDRRVMREFSAQAAIHKSTHSYSSNDAEKLNRANGKLVEVEAMRVQDKMDADRLAERNRSISTRDKKNDKTMENKGWLSTVVGVTGVVGAFVTVAASYFTGGVSAGIAAAGTAFSKLSGLLQLPKP